MSYETINENFYRCDTCGPTGLQLSLQYDKTNGNYRLIEKNALGVGPAIFYENGSFFLDATRDPKLFETQDPNKLTTEGQNLSNRIRKEVFNVYNAQGGQAKGNVANSSILPANQTAKPAVSNANPGTSPGISSSILGGAASLFDLLTPGINVNVGFATVRNPALGQVLTYPIDLIETGQDVLEITQIEYQAPNKNIFSGNADISKILSEGVARNTIVKQVQIGRVIFPIPNNAQDSNSVSWQGSTLNPVTGAAGAAVANTPIPAAAAAYGGKPLGELVKTFFPNNPALATAATELPKYALQAYLLYLGGTNQNSQAAVKAGLFSNILNRLGFDIPPETILSRSAGIIPNSNLELLFNNVTLRNFGFSFLMTPRSADEAKRINLIIRFFKQGMAAKKQSSRAGAPSLFLGTPNVFKLEYKSGTTQIKGMNKFKLCALTNFSVNYVPTGQWSAYEGGQPTSVLISMAFNEVEPIYESDYTPDKRGTFSNELSSVADDEIGY